MKLCRILTPHHIDDILQKGDALYTNTAEMLDDNELLADDKLLSNDQLPPTFVIQNCRYIIEYYNLIYGKLNPSADSELDSLESVIQKGLNISTKNILVLERYMMAICEYSHRKYLVFDPHSRNANGLIDDDGSAVALYFTDIDNLLTYIQCLTLSLQLSANSLIGMQPITVKCEILSNGDRFSQSFHDLENEPSCSTSSDINYCQSSMTPKTNDHTEDGLTKYQRWYRNMPKIKEKRATGQKKQ